MLVAAVSFVPGAEEAVSARSVVVTSLVFVTGMKTLSTGTVVKGRDWMGVVVGAFRVELSAVLERIVEVVTSGDVSG